MYPVGPANLFLSGISADREGFKYHLTHGCWALRPRKVGFHHVRGVSYPQHLRLYGFPFNVDTPEGGIVPLSGDLIIGGEKIPAEKRAQLGWTQVLDAAGKPVELSYPTYPVKRKFYVPGNYTLPEVRNHRIIDVAGGQPKVELLRGSRVVEGPEEFEQLIHRLSPDNARALLEGIQKQAREIVERRFQRPDPVADEEKYRRDNFARNYLGLLALYVRNGLMVDGQPSKLANLKNGCALGFGGTGVKYWGQLKFPGGDGKAVLADGEVENPLKGLHPSSVGGMTVVAEKNLLDSQARGVVLDRGYLPTSLIPVGGSGLDDFDRARKDAELRAHGAVFSEYCVWSECILAKPDVDRVCAPHSMCDETHFLARERPELQGLYMPVTIVLDTTQRFSEVLNDPAGFLLYLTEFLSEPEREEFAGMLGGVLERFVGGREDAIPDADVDRFSSLFLKAAKKLRGKALETMARNMRAVSDLRLTISYGFLTPQNLSPALGIADTGDLYPAGKVVDKMFGQQKDSMLLLVSWAQDLLHLQRVLGVSPRDFMQEGSLMKLIGVFIGAEDHRILRGTEDRLVMSSVFADETRDACLSMPAPEGRHAVVRNFFENCNTHYLADNRYEPIAVDVTRFLMATHAQVMEARARQVEE